MIINLRITGTWLTELINEMPSLHLRKDDASRNYGDKTSGSIVNYAGRIVSESVAGHEMSTSMTFIDVTNDEEDQLMFWWQNRTPLLLRDALGWYRTGVLSSASMSDTGFNRPNGESFKTISVKFSDISWDFSA